MRPGDNYDCIACPVKTLYLILIIGNHSPFCQKASMRTNMQYAGCLALTALCKRKRALTHMHLSRHRIACVSIHLLLQIIASRPHSKMRLPRLHVPYPIGILLQALIGSYSLIGLYFCYDGEHTRVPTVFSGVLSHAFDPVGTISADALFHIFDYRRCSGYNGGRRSVLSQHTGLPKGHKDNARRRKFRSRPLRCAW